MISDNNAIMGLPIEVGQEVPNVDFPVRVENEQGDIDWGVVNTTGGGGGGTSTFLDACTRVCVV